MPSYEQIKDIEKQLYDALSDFQYAINNTDFKQVFANAEKYEFEKHVAPTYFREKHNQMILRLYTYIVNKIPRHTALKLILEEFNHNEPIIVQHIVDDVYIQQARNMRPQKIYAAHILKKAGISNKKIATLLNVTSTTAAKYLKIKLEIDN